MKSKMPLLIVLLVMALIPNFLPLYYRDVLTEVLIFGLFALGFDIIFGFTGLLNFGMATFFGLGGNITLFTIVHLYPNIWVALLLTVIGLALFSLVYACFIVRFKSHYFVAFTLVVSQVLYLIAMSQRSLTGADEGLTFDVPRLQLGFASLPFGRGLTKYYFTFTICAIVFALVRNFFKTPYGMAIIAVRENEGRAEMIGYNTFQLKIVSFTLSGVVAGLAGGLYALHLGFSSAHTFLWMWTARAVWWTVIGGLGSLIGAFVGPAVLVFLEDFISSWNPDYYLIIMGLLMIVFIMAVPRGLVSIVKKAFGAQRAT